MRLLALLLVACGDPAKDTAVGDTAAADTDTDADTDVASGPDIALDPATIDFGWVDVGEAVTEVVTVRNVGREDLEIWGVSVENPRLGFSVSAIGAVRIPPGASTTFSVTYAPDEVARADTDVLVTSNDADEPEVAVHLGGTSAGAELSLSPGAYDFGTLPIGCEATQVLTLANPGNADLVVTELAYVSASDELTLDPRTDVNGPLPWTLAPGSTVDVLFTYAPLDAYPDEAYLSVSSNDADGAGAVATQRGTAVPVGENVDTFVVRDPGRVDFVFAVDTSASMSEELASLGLAVESFLDTLDAEGADYQVAIVERDDGCVNGAVPFVDATMIRADQLDRLGDMLTYVDGAYAEAGFTLLENALSDTNLASGGCNEGLVRDDAVLALVGVTDKVEASLDSWNTYVSDFQAMKADPDDVVVHAVAGDFPSGCGDAEPGQGWYEASVATGGRFLSICDTDREGQFGELVAGSIADPTQFELSSWPVEASIVVTVDGVEVTSGWTYAGTDNRVEFEDAPPPDSVVEITYTIVGECPE